MDFFEEWGRNLENAKYLYAFLSEKEYVNQIFPVSYTHLTLPTSDLV